MSSLVPAYTPRWLWRTYRFFERLPIPFWLVGTVVVVASAVAHHLVAWEMGLVPRGRLNPYLSAVGLYAVVVPSVWQLLNRQAMHAFRELESRLGKGRIDVTLPRFLSMPAWLALVAVVVGAVGGYLEFHRTAAQLVPMSQVVLPWLGAINWIVTGSVVTLCVFRAVVQIWLLRRLFEQIDLDLFNPAPVYTLSRCCAAYAVTGLLVGHGLVLLSMPSYYLSTSGLLYVGIVTLVAIVIFVAPLSAVHGRMRLAKEALLGQIGEDQKRINDRLHVAINHDSLTDIDQLRLAVAALKEQREVLERLPVWPWRGQTIRGLVPALLVPLIVYLSQRLLSMTLGI